MTILETRLNPRSPEFKANAEAMNAQAADLKTKITQVSAGGGAEARAKHAARGKLLPRDRVQLLLDPGTPFLELSQLAAWEHVRRRRAVGRHHHRRRARVGPRVRDRLQRRHRQGRHLLPDDGEETPARAGDRAREPPAVHLPGRLRRRQSAEPGRRVPGPRALRPHLLQPGDAVGGRHPADRRRAGFVHGRRRVRAGDERRVDHRRQPGHDLPRRPAAGEGGHRRGRHGGRSRRRRRAHAAVRRGRSPGVERRARAGTRAPHPCDDQLRQAAAACSCASRARRATRRPNSTA